MVTNLSFSLKWAYAAQSCHAYTTQPHVVDNDIVVYGDPRHGQRKYAPNIELVRTTAGRGALARYRAICSAYDPKEMRLCDLSDCTLRSAGSKCPIIRAAPRTKNPKF